MKIIVGLGNPDKKYESTRHNLGARVLDLVAPNNDWENKYNSQFMKLDEVILAKPQTYMNKSGEAIKEILKYYPAPEMLIVIHDDLDFPLGAIRIQENISGAGHNGIQSIIDELGTQNFIRIRLGINNPESRGQIPADDFVLQKFTSVEKKIVTEVLDKARDAIEIIHTQGLEAAQNKFNG